LSWSDAIEFIKQLNKIHDQHLFSLPTEAQWEYAARAGSTTAFANGNITELGCDRDPNLDTMGWYCGNSAVTYSGCYNAAGWGGSECAGTHPVAQKDPNNWGLFDMHGNVWEWCQDWYEDYNLKELRDPKGPEGGSFRVVRGGGWVGSARFCRSSDRDGLGAGGRYNYIGLRLVRLAP
jgi:formylglycine-generating enzyme required for sulfatase activity